MAVHIFAYNALVQTYVQMKNSQNSRKKISNCDSKSVVQSSDLNPMEAVWNILRQSVRRRKRKTKDDLTDAEQTVPHENTVSL